MADDFEKAVFYAFAQPGTAPADVSARAGAALEAARAGPQAWALCLAHLRSSAHAEVKFWCLQTLHGLVGERYGELAPDQRDALKSALVGTALGDPGLAPFLRAKLAQVLVGVACREFPSAWPAFFQDLIATLPAGPPAADLFCRVLVAVDEDVVSLEVPRSAAEARASMAFKDAMRDLALPDVAAAATQLLAASHAADPPAAAALLRALARYVHWVDIGLVANDRFVPLLFGVLGSRDEGLRAAAAGVLIEIVGKRMEAEPKLALIQQLGVVPEAAKWAEGLPGAEDGDAGLLACLATEILEAVKKIENAVLSMAAVGLAVDDEAGREAEASARGACALLDALFPALLRALGGGGEEVVAAVLPFLLSYVGWRRAAYLLCRLTKALRGPLRGAAQGVLAALAPHLAAIAASPAAELPGPKAAPGRGPGGAALTAVDDRLYAFEAAGLLLGQEEMEAGVEAAWLAAVLQPLTRQIEEALGEGPGPSNGSAALVPPALMVQQALEGITRVAKGFSLRLCTELRPALGAEFTRALRCAIQVPRRLPGHRALRARLLSFLHRMVETLGPASLPFMPEVLQALVREGADACELADALILLNQLMSRFRDGMAPLIRDILPVLLSCVHAVLGPDWDWSGAAVPGSPPAASAETAREKEELQRAFFACLLCVATMGLADQLLAAGSATLDGALGPLLQTLHRLLSVWMEPSKESGAAITTFAVEKFAGELGWPAAASTQLLQLIADGDHKVLRDFLRQALQQQPRPAAAKLD
ncbi:Exportin-T [Auxenochlorella protothecoides]|uniref:Exportin-T n=1 Tax=Auxenochlorella protothecoides TaxID=3075 RepID=A0A087SB30_AUXPR|nr:Exportin-T [Auxenochlorella protothecoides]KFM22934.1 Exportin-T [Auxenochlorella protothecoides]